jgi:hypothetical protein
MERPLTRDLRYCNRYEQRLNYQRTWTNEPNLVRKQSELIDIFCRSAEFKMTLVNEVVEFYGRDNIFSFDVKR